MTGTRYRLLETVRHYAVDRLAEAGEVEVLGRRHAEWYTEHARAYEAVASPEETMWLARGLAELDNLRAAVAFLVGHGDTDLAVQLVGRLWRLYPLWHPELLRWARQVLKLPGAADHHDVGYVHVIVASLAWITGDLDGTERAAGEALRCQLDEDAWSIAMINLRAVLGYRDDIDRQQALALQADEWVTRPANRVVRDVMSFSGELAGRPTGYDPIQLIADADATGIPHVRAFTRTIVALGMVGRDRSVDTVPLIIEALEIVEPGVNRSQVNLAHEILALVSATGPTSPVPGELPDRAAKALDLNREYPLALDFAILGMLVRARQLGRRSEAAMLAGYLTGRIDELAINPRSVPVIAGEPLDSFVTPETESEFERGRTMTRDALMAELARLAAEEPA